MINTDYPVESLNILLNEDCLSDRFHSLISIREDLITGLKRLGCVTKSDVSRLSDDELAGILHDGSAVKLFRRFLTVYDPKSQKFREIVKLVSDPAEQKAFEELYHLPGVRFTRAHLYYHSGYKTLQDFSKTTVEEVLSKTTMTISEKNLSCIVPLPKEVRTHIAVARAFSR
ncbi:MAG: hypothetical protein CW338_07535 [Clostridiales bacterium]|nr:hypothetical protein [Clostridiales bacterium]